MRISRSVDVAVGRRRARPELRRGARRRVVRIAQEEDVERRRPALDVQDLERDVARCVRVRHRAGVTALHRHGDGPVREGRPAGARRERLVQRDDDVLRRRDVRDGREVRRQLPVPVVDLEERRPAAERDVRRRPCRTEKIRAGEDARRRPGVVIRAVVRNVDREGRVARLVVRPGREGRELELESADRDDPMGVARRCAREGDPRRDDGDRAGVGRDRREGETRGRPRARRGRLRAGARDPRGGPGGGGLDGIGSRPGRERGEGDARPSSRW